MLGPCSNLWLPLHPPCSCCLTAFLWLAWTAPTASSLSLSSRPPPLCSQGCLLTALHIGSRHSPGLRDKRGLSARHPRLLSLLFPFPFLPLPPEIFLHPRASLPLFLILAIPPGLSRLGSSHTFPKKSSPVGWVASPLALVTLYCNQGWLDIGHREHSA